MPIATGRLASPGLLRYDRPVYPRSPAAFFRPFFVAASLTLAFVLAEMRAAEPRMHPTVQAPELLPQEKVALRHESTGDWRAAIDELLQLAQATAADANGDRATAARVEAWATEAAGLLRNGPSAELLQRFDDLAASPLAKAQPLLADRIGIAVFAACNQHPAADAEARIRRLGVLREFWITGPFANERGSGYRRALPPEEAFDLDAEFAGKQRTVRWRQLPPVGSHGALGIGRVVDPHEQSLAYVALALVADQATEVVLELGCTGSFRVFCNRTEVAAREVERPFGYDQDSIVLPLAAGPNLLLLKLCHQEGNDFWAVARLRSRDGSPLRGVRPSVVREDLVAAAATTAVTTTEAPVADMGGRSHWTIGETVGADALRLAWLWAPRAADGDKDRRDLAAAAAAAAALPDLAEAHLLVAAASERHARSAADRDENARRRSLERALVCDPDNTEALVRLGQLLRSTSNLWRQARTLADRALAIRPDHFSALSLRLASLRDEGLDALADQQLLAAAQAPTASPALLRLAADAIEGRDPRLGLSLRQRVLAASTAEGDLCAVATLLARTGKADDAQALLRRAIASSEYSGQARWQLANLLLVRDEADQARGLLEQWLAVAPDDASTMALVARCWRRHTTDVAESTVRTQEMLRSALEVEPTRRDDERYVEFLAAATAGADATPFYASFQRDAAAIVKADAGAPDDAAAAKDPLHWLLRQQVVRANKNGTKNVYSHDVVRVLTEDGARFLANYRLPFWSGEQRARLLGCTIFRKDGSVQRPVLQGARVRMPDLRPGDTVAVEGRIDDLQPSFFGDYFGWVHSFAGPEGSPVRSNELVVLADPGRDYTCQASNGAPEPERTTLADGTLQFRWSMQEVRRDLPEIRRPDRKEYEPIVRMTTYRDWDHFASWWWNLIKNQLEVTPSMRATIARLTQGLDSTDAKIAAIYEFVTTEVRYEAWEFGVHGYKPYSTAVIHERRHGDCKDKALLLCAMLGEIGVACHPVIIHADSLRSRDDLELAMVEHFNHCIAWLPATGDRPGRFLDGTATWHPVDTLPDMDQGARVLVVDKGKAELRLIAETTPATNQRQDEHLIVLRADGSGTLEVGHAPIGNEAVALRAMLATEPARRREVVERDLVQTFGKLVLGELTASDPLDLDTAVQLRATATLTEVGQRTATQWQLPSAWNTGDLQSLAVEPERHTPLLLGVPNGVTKTLRYRLPDGWRATDLPPAVERTAPFGTFTMQWRTDGREVTVERRLAFTTSRIEAVDHAAFRDFAGAVKAADDQRVLLIPEGGR